MSRTLRKNKGFLTLLLTTDPAQARALLNIITTKQVEAIVEIAYNLMRIATSETEKAVIKKRRTLLKKLVNKKLKLPKTKKLIALHRLALLKTLLHFKRELLHVIQ